MNNSDKKDEIFLIKVLDDLEDREERSIVWGITDRFFTRSEINYIIEEHLDKQFDQDPDAISFRRDNEVIDELLKKGLIFVAENRDEAGYRTRMAETMRLLVRLRQIFPKHVRSSNGWSTAPTLVSDYRFQRAKRRIPKRDINVDKFLDRLCNDVTQPDLSDHLQLILRILKEEFNINEYSHFQFRATKRILQSIISKKRNSTIICAGTSSGKTLAYFLPIFISILKEKISESEPWTKSVSVYPRNELLKDQLKTILNWTQKINQSLENPITIGVLYGDVPVSFSLATSWNWSFHTHNDRSYLKCKIFDCPSCDSVVILTDDNGLLKCTNETCDWNVSTETLLINRDALSESPPDILLVSTESLNEQLGNYTLNNIFGIGDMVKPPQMVMLDEVHLYEGLTGANVSYLFRRWQKLLRGTLRYVGLSATVRNATDFFSDLTGEFETGIEEVTPAETELETTGAQYQVLLRGDPVSRAQLLSTTVQTAMLSARMLDTSNSISNGIYGKKLFVFADDLDGINRFHYIMNDAEGRRGNGEPNPDKECLASFRSRGLSVSRYNFGQDWRATEEIGHSLSERKVIDKVTSANQGVDNEANIFIASSSLEVGFDDNTVGAVVQHKTSRQSASLIQRKGRAGRTGKMRSWFINILSDYGRDRVSYQNYDEIFDPELNIRFLPNTNRYILRIQLVFSLFDYLSTKLKRSGLHPNLLYDLKEYRGGFPFPCWGVYWKDRDKEKIEQRKNIKEALKQIIENSSERKNFFNYFYSICNPGKVPNISENDIESLFWEPPRSLMTEVIPTILSFIHYYDYPYRSASSPGNESESLPLVSIERDRTNLKQEKIGHWQTSLPDFLPGKLFNKISSELVHICETVEPEDRDPYTRTKGTIDGVGFALRLFSPGKVQQRFQYPIVSLPESLTSSMTTCDYEIEEFCGGGRGYEFLGNFLYSESGSNSFLVPVFKPLTIRTWNPRKFDIKNTSNSSLNWCFEKVEKYGGSEVSLPTDSALKNIVCQMKSFLHKNNQEIEIRRFCVFTDMELKRGQTETQRVQSRFVHKGQVSGIGFTSDTDGILISIKVPTDLVALVSEQPNLIRVLRLSRFHYLAESGEALSSVANVFQRKWIAEIFLSSILIEALTQKITLEEAISNVLEETSALSIHDVLLEFLQSHVAEDERNPEDGTLNRTEDLLLQDLDAILNLQETIDELYELGTVLYSPVGEKGIISPIGARYNNWLKETFASTIGQAILNGINDLCPEFDVSELNLDIEKDAKNKKYSIWITENVEGGLGNIELFLQRYVSDPRYFFDLVRCSLERNEFEIVDEQLTDVLAELRDSSSGIKTSIEKIRQGSGQSDIEGDISLLEDSLRKKNFMIFHSFRTALSSRILREESTAELDNYLLQRYEEWRDFERTLGIEIDLRVISFLFSTEDDLEHAVPWLEYDGPEEGRRAWRMSVIYGLFWGRGRDIRNKNLNYWSQFSKLLSAERLLCLPFIQSKKVVLKCEGTDSIEVIKKELVKGKLVSIRVPLAKKSVLVDLINLLLVTPIESDYLLTYARLKGVNRENEELEASFELPEAVINND